MSKKVNNEIAPPVAYSGGESHLDQRNIVSCVSSAIADAQRAVPMVGHYPAGMSEPTAYIKTSMVRSIIATLKTQVFPGRLDENGHLVQIPGSAPAGSMLKLDAALIKASRVARAGANVVVYPEASKPHVVGPEGYVVMERLPSAFRTIEAATFGTVSVDVEDEAPVITLPFSTASIDWTGGIAKAVRFEIKRSERNKYSENELSENIILALTLGLSRCADEVLLSAINSLTLEGFTLGAAAAQGVAFGELRGLIGSSGAGASVAADGSLRAAGVAAKLTGDMAGTVIGAWNRACVAIKDDVTILFERLDTAGTLAVTVWASMLALVPDSNKFWKAS